MVFTMTTNTTTIPSMIFGQNMTTATKSNATQTAQVTANQTEAAAGKSTQGVQVAINQTGQFLGNVSETFAENPVVINATGETQEFSAEKSK